MSSVLEVVLKLSDDFTNPMSRAQGNFEKFAHGIAKSLAAAFSVSAVIYGMKEMISHSMELAEQIAKTSKTIGMSTDEAQRWDYVAKQNETSLAAMSRGFIKLSQSAYLAITGNEKAAGTFKTLGINLQDANGNLKDQATLTKETIFALADIENTSQRAALAQTLFGKSTKEMLPLLAEGKEKLQEQTDAFDRMGLKISGSTIKALDDAGDAGKTMSTAMAVLGAEISVLAAGPLVKLSIALAECLGGMRRFFKPDELSKEDKARDKIAQLGAEYTNLESQIKLAAKTNQQFVVDLRAASLEPIPVEKIKTQMVAIKKEQDALIKSLQTAPIEPDFSGTTKKESGEGGLGLGVGKALSRSVQSFASNNKFVVDNTLALYQDFSVQAIDITTVTAMAMHDIWITFSDTLEGRFHGMFNTLVDLNMDWKDKVSSIFQQVYNSAMDLLWEYLSTFVRAKMVEYTTSISVERAKQAANLTTAGTAVAGAAAEGGKSVANTPYVGAVLAIAAIAAVAAAGWAMIEKSKKYGLGGDFYTSGPQMIMVGDNPGARERVRIDPTSSPNVNGGGDRNLIVHFHDNSGDIVESFRRKIRGNQADQFINDLKLRMG